MWGQCRRHSPALNPLSAKSYLVEGVWPLVRDDDWCGEWKAATRVSLARARFAPAVHDLTATTAAAAATAALASSEHSPEPIAAIAAAGD